MATMPTTKQIISTMGFTSTRDFQRAWNLGPALAVDGVIRAKTRSAAQISWRRRMANKPDLSVHFYADELACRCGGKLEGCRGLLIERRLLVGLERLRETSYPNGLVIISGYRCTRRNAAVGGVTGSKHILGQAADIPGVLSHTQMRQLKIFTGLGYRSSDRKVVHVDVRPGTASAPTTWAYA
jgi:hypothetical protein